MGDKTDYSGYQNTYHSYHLRISLTNLLSRLIPYAARNCLGSLILMRYSAFIQYLRNNCNKMRQYIRCSEPLRRPMIQSDSMHCVRFSMEPLQLKHEQMKPTIKLTYISYIRGLKQGNPTTPQLFNNA
jgi:hypothetical protein